MTKTSLDPEEYAYPSGSLAQSRRYAHAICEDGKIRKIKISIADTYFSIPGRTTIDKKTVSGYIMLDDGELHFHAKGREGK